MKKVNNKTLVLILTMGVFSILNTEMGIVGVIPYVSERFSVSIPDAGLLVSGFALIVALAGPTMPLLFSKINRKKSNAFVTRRFFSLQCGVRVCINF